MTKSQHWLCSTSAWPCSTFRTVFIDNSFLSIRGWNFGLGLWEAVSVAAIRFCLKLQSRTTLNFNISTIDRPVLWQSHHHLLTVSHRYIFLHWLPVNFRKDFKSVYWPMKHLVKSNLFTCRRARHITPIPSIEITHRNNSVCFQGHAWFRYGAFWPCTPSLWNHLPLSVHSAADCNLQETSENTSLWFGYFSIHTSVTNGQLMSWTVFRGLLLDTDSAICTTEPGLTGDIRAIEVWLIDNIFLFSLAALMIG